RTTVNVQSCYCTMNAQFKSHLKAGLCQVEAITSPSASISRAPPEFHVYAEPDIAFHNPRAEGPA
ncbi:MAG: hypothetical protein ACP5MD_12065, partial [Verrucomicrobiia bacterium]